MPAGHTCPVCDYPNLSEPPRSEFGGGSFEICPSCGFQFGVNDDDEGISYETWRRRWEAAGMPWSSVALKQPASWKPVAKHVAPGGAALRRPVPATEPPAAAAVPAATVTKRDPSSSAASSTARKSAEAPPAAKPANPKKNAVPAKSSKPSKSAKPVAPAKKPSVAKKAPVSAKKSAAKKQPGGR